MICAILSILKQNEKQLILFTLKKAVKNGANGLLINQLFFAPKDKFGTLASGYHLTATAIKIKDAK